jgi:hypothetical protein
LQYRIFGQRILVTSTESRISGGDFRGISGTGDFRDIHDFRAGGFPGHPRFSGGFSGRDFRDIHGVGKHHRDFRDIHRADFRSKDFRDIQREGFAGGFAGHPLLQTPPERLRTSPIVYN